MTKLPFNLILILLTTFSPQLLATINNMGWQLEYEQAALRIYSGQKNQFGINRYKVEMDARSTIDGFIRLILNTDYAPNWIASCDSVELLASPNTYEHIVKTTFNAPWPFKNRELITHSIISHQLNHTDIYINDFKYPAEIGGDNVLIDSFSAHYRLTQLPNELLKIQYTVSSYAGGVLPTWLANTILKQELTQTFLNMQHELNSITK